MSHTSLLRPRATSAGVSAVGQVLSFYLQAPIGADALQAALSAVAPDDLRAHSVELAPRAFHGEEF